MAGKEDDEVEAFWNKLSVRQRENTSKRFETQRLKDGADKSCKKAIAGQGRNQKAGQLMRLYLEDACLPRPPGELDEQGGCDEHGGVGTPRKDQGTACWSSRTACRAAAFSCRGRCLTRTGPSSRTSARSRMAQRRRITRFEDHEDPGKATWQDFKMFEKLEVKECATVDFNMQDSDLGVSEGESVDAKSLTMELFGGEGGGQAGRAWRAEGPGAFKSLAKGPEKSQGLLEEGSEIRSR